MKKLFMLVFVLIFWVNVMEAQKQPKETERQEFHRGYLDGKKQGEAEKQFLWAEIGCASALFLGGCIGGCGSAVASQTIEPSPSLSSITEESLSYQLGFEKGYIKAVKRKRLENTIGGALAGTIALLMIYFLSTR